MAESTLITTLMRPFVKRGQDAAFTLPGALGAESRVLCIDSGDLADLVFHAPLLTAYKRRHPGAAMDFLVPEPHVDLVAQSGLAHHCVVYREGQLNPWRPAYGSLLRKLGAGHYDVAVVMSFQPHPRLELGALASGAALRLGPSHADNWPAVNFEVRRPPDAGGYYGDRMTTVAPFLGFAAAELKPRWPLPGDRLRHMAQQVHFHKPNPDHLLVGIDPGVSKGGHAFAPENLQFLVRQLATQLVCKVLPLADPADRERLDRFTARLPETPLGLPRATLMDMMLIASQCDLFLGGNTDLMHFAVAMGVPTVALFGEDEDPCYRPVGRARARVLDVASGEKVDIETLMEAVEAVTGGRTGRPTTVLAPTVETPPADPSAPADPPAPADAGPDDGTAPDVDG
ncbi:MAG: glycosyltransferase family 9 protein [Candidatus Krumholzibacteriia bacterium]